MSLATRLDRLRAHLAQDEEALRLLADVEEAAVEDEDFEEPEKYAARVAAANARYEAEQVERWRPARTWDEQLERDGRALVERMSRQLEEGMFAEPKSFNTYNLSQMVGLSVLLK